MALIPGIAAALGNSLVLAKDLATCRVYSSMWNLIFFFPVVYFLGRKKREIGQQNQSFAFRMTVRRGWDFFKGLQTTDGYDEVSKKESQERVKHVRPFTVFSRTVAS